MRGHPRVCAEPATTPATNVRLFPGVRSLVILQGTPLGETSIADPASEGFFPAVGAFMLVEVSPLRESLSADCARVRFRGPVGTDMHI
jgi:hypothetical protein